jgi:hypothetical protein
LIATLGVIFSMQAQFADRLVVDVPARIALAAISMVALFHADRQVAWFACLSIGLFIGYWWLLRRHASPAQAASGAA